MSNSDLRSALSLAAVMVIGVSGLMSIVIVGSYPTYLADKGNQNACEDAFGPDATYVGTTGAGMEQKGALCQTNDGLKVVESQMAPMNFQTTKDYLTAVINGET